MPRRAVNTRFDEAGWKAFKVVANAEGMTLSEFVRIAVKRAIKAHNNGEQLNPSRKVK